VFQDGLDDLPVFLEAEDPHGSPTPPDRSGDPLNQGIEDGGHMRGRYCFSQVSVLPMRSLRPDTASRRGRRAAPHHSGAVLAANGKVGSETSSHHIEQGDLRPSRGAVGAIGTVPTMEVVRHFDGIGSRVCIGGRPGNHVPALVIAQPNDLGRPIRNYIAGRIRIIRQVALRGTAGIRKATGGEDRTSDLLGDQLQSGQRRNGIGLAPQQVVHGPAEATVDNIDAVIGSVGECLAIGGGCIGIVIPGIAGSAELVGDLLGVGACGGSISPGDSSFVGPNEHVRMTIVAGDRVRAGSTVVIRGGEDQGQDVGFTPRSQSPQHGVIAHVIGIVCHVRIHNNVDWLHWLLQGVIG